MLFQDPAEIGKEFLFINITIGTINLALDIIIVFYVINQLYIKKESREKKLEKKQYINLTTWGLFFLLITIANIILLIRALNELNNPLPSETYNVIEKTAILLIYSAFFTKILYLEYTLNDLKLYKGYYFSIAFSIVMIFIFLLDLESIKEPGVLQYIFLALLVFGYSIIPILYLYLAIKTVGQSRKDSFKVCVGSIMFALGSMAGPANLYGYYGFYDIIDLLIRYSMITGPLCVILATIIIFDSFRSKKENT